MGFRVDNEERNPKAEYDAHAKTWIIKGDPALLENGEQNITFGKVSVPVFVEDGRIVVHAGKVKDADREKVVLPQLAGYIDVSPPPLSNLETVDDLGFKSFEAGDVVLYIYQTRGGNRAAVVFQD